jgi:prolyl-tRNA synthetase
MKDAYSFHMAVEGEGGLAETYDRMYEAYVNVFRRCGLDFSVVEAEAGPIGGSASHEFMVNAESGEDRILRCPESGYAANVEKCEIGEREWSFDGKAGAVGGGGVLEKVHTPRMPGIESVAAHLGVTASEMLKTIVFKRTDGVEPAWVLAVVRGDHEVNEGKMRDAAGGPVGLADEKEARAAGFAIGYVSPRAGVGHDLGEAGSLCKALVVVDADAAQGGRAWVTGADEADYHVRHFEWRREMGDALDHAECVRVADIRNAMAGDPSPRAAGARLVEQRGIEVGHIFKLGCKYSDAMGFAVMDRDQKRQSVIMGCYGIGVTRTMQACVEMSCDENGIIWPMAIAPYHVEIVVMKPDQANQAEAAERLAGGLAEAGLDVLIDDRAERPGVKFNDADLIGVPIRITIGDKALEQGGVELKLRRDEGKGELVGMDEVVGRCAGLA